MNINYRKNLSFGYIDSKYSTQDLLKKELFIEVSKEKYPAILETIPLKDKKNRLS